MVSQTNEMWSITKSNSISRNRGINMAQIWHEYSRDTRKAIVKRNTKGFFVNFYEDNTKLEKRKVYKHSESYAENVAENWVEGIISNPSG